MTMKSILRFILAGMLILLGSCFISADSVAKDALVEAAAPLLDIPLLDFSPSLQKQYLVKISGTVMNETFSGAQALLTLSGPVPGSKYNNPYLLIIEGFPKQNSINSFYWSGENSEMTAVANEITCDIKRTFVKPVPTHFMFLSPELLRHTGALAVKAGDEGIKFAERVALPLPVYARAGRLKLLIHSNSLSGTVWMKGYDPTERAFVQYSARLYGIKTYKLKPLREQKKITTVRE